MVVCQQKKHRFLSEGRWRGCVDREPLHLAFRAREGLVVVRWHVDRRNTPSISRFEQGRGVLTSPSISRFEQGRGGWGVSSKETPSISRFERGRGWWWRDGVSTEETPPPSRNSSEGGDGEGGCSNTTKRDVSLFVV